MQQKLQQNFERLQLKLGGAAVDPQLQAEFIEFAAGKTPLMPAGLLCLGLRADGNR
jgi:hypothetical protein